MWMIHRHSDYKPNGHVKVKTTLTKTEPCGTLHSEISDPRLVTGTVGTGLVLPLIATN